MKKGLLITLAFFWLAGGLAAQVVTMEPSDATVDDTVTILFDATKGDQGLMNFDGDVYAHTGVITLESDNGSDWKHVVADWGSDDEKVLMTREDENLYSLSFHIKSYYGIEENETILELAFVFRNVDGSMSARNADGSDIFVPLSTPTDNYISHTMDENRLIVTGSTLKYVLTPWSQNIINLAAYKDDIVADSSYAIIGEQQSMNPVLEEEDSLLIFSFNNIDVKISKNPLKFEYQVNGKILTQHSSSVLNSSAVGGLFDFQVDATEHFYGAGSRAIPVDRRGYNLDFYNQAHYGYSNGTQNLNISIPFIVSSKNYGLFFDNQWPASMDMASSGNTFRYRAENGVMEYFFISGDSQPEILENFTSLTGRQELPPLWALGYIQSRYGYQNQQEAENVVEQMQEEHFPMDALVLDLYWFGNTNDMGNLDWDNSRFPQPVQMMENFQNDGIKTVLISEPYFTLESDNYNYLAQNDLLATDQSGDPFVLQGFWAGDAGLLDMTKEDARDWMWQHYQARNEEGVSGWWTDLGEPESHPAEMQHQEGSASKIHNIYNLEWQRMLYEKHAAHYPKKRLLNLSRSGWAGMQRYSTFPWSGDIQRSFSGLQAQIPIMLGMSMSGVGYMHSDIGGFTGGGQQPELYTRWMQLGAFTPVMRAHGTGVPTEPIFYNEATQDRVRKMINLRYDFLPCNYNLAWEYTTKGIPLARPVNFYEPSNQQLANINDEFLWGKNVLVAPVLEENQTTKEVVFPSGKWYDYRNNTLYQGNQSVTVDAPIDELPLFIRSGSFIMQSSEKLMNTAEYDSDSLQVKYYLPHAGVETNDAYYFDDGTTRGTILDGSYELIGLKGSSDINDVIIEIEKGYDGYGLNERAIEFEVNGFAEKPAGVKVNGDKWEIAENASYYYSADKVAYWSEEKERFRVKFPWSDTLTRINIARPGVGVEEIAAGNSAFNLHNPSPNPFAKNTAIAIDVMKSGVYQFTLSDISGNRMNVIEKRLYPGRIHLELRELVQSGNLESGIYFLNVSHRTQKETVKMIKVR